MALPASGTISMSQINTELGLGTTTPISLNASNVRSLARVASGSISMSHLHGKSNNPYIAGSVQYSTPGTFTFNPTATTIYVTVIAGGGGGHGPNSDYYGAGGGGSGGWYYNYTISGLAYGETCTAVVGAGGPAGYNGGSGGSSALYTSTHGLVLNPSGGKPHSITRSAAGPGGSPNGIAGGAGSTASDGRIGGGGYGSGFVGTSGKGGNCSCPTYGGVGGASVTAEIGTAIHGKAGGVGAGGSGGACSSTNTGTIYGGAGGNGFIRVYW